MDIVIVGAGHNGLICACYLARQGFSVTVYERRKIVGGLCVTEEIFPDYKVSTVASYYGMLREEIVQELDLMKYGLTPYLTNPIEIVLLADGQYVFTPRDGSDSQIKIAGLTEEDLKGWKNFWSDMGKAARIVYPYYTKSTSSQQELILALEEAGLSAISQQLFQGTLLDLLKQYFTNKHLVAAVATTTPGFANKAGSVFGCIHHGTAKTLGEFGAWGFVKGGMGEVTQSLLKRAQNLGVKVITNCPIDELIMKDGWITHVRRADGQIDCADLVISNADPFTTVRLLPKKAVALKTDLNPEKQVPAVSAGKVHFALKSLPKFPLFERIGHNYSGIIVIAPPIEAVIDASDNVPRGILPEQLMLTMAFPSMSDETIAPPGKHLLTVDIHYLPRFCKDEPWDKKNKEKILASTLSRIEEYAPEFRKYVEDTFVVSPTEVDTVYGVSTASCWHFPMTTEFLMEKRSMQGSRPHETKVPNLFLCGAGTYPGGNVTGVPGYNCARKVLSTALQRIS